MAAGSSNRAPPLLSETADYGRWKKELAVWRIATDTKPDKQAATVIMSLKGKYQEVALDMTEDDMKKNDGLKLLLEMLDKVFLGDKRDRIYSSYVKFEKLERSSDETVGDFILRYEKGYKEIKALGMDFNDSVLALKLLCCSKLEENDRKMILTACDETTYAKITSAMKRIVGSQVPVFQNQTALQVKKESEECMFTRRGQSRGSSWRQRGSQNRNNSSYSRESHGKINPRNKFGDISKCNRCGSIYHWAASCHADIKDRRESAYVTEKEDTNSKGEDEEDGFEEANIVLFTNNAETFSEVFLAETFSQGIIDTACSKTVCGERWYENFKQKCKDNVKEEKSDTPFKFGSGKVMRSEKLVYLPVKLGSKCCTVVSEVVRCDIPLLLSKDSLSKADTVIDLKTHNISMFGKKVPVMSTSNGHFAIDVMRSVSNNKQDIGDEKQYVAESVVLLASHFKDGNREDKKKIIQKLHIQFAHASYDKVATLLKNAKEDSKENLQILKDVTDTCEMCIQYKKTPARPRMCLPRANSFNESIAVDLHQLKPNLYLLHMIDEFSRFSVGKTVKTKTSKEFVTQFISAWIAYFGCPQRLFSDNGGEFNSNLVRDLGENFNIDIITTPAYSPWSNGLVERHNGILSLMIKKLRLSFPEQHIDTLVAWACAAKNSLSNRDGFAPNQLVFGKNTNYPSVLNNKLPALECITQDQSIADTIEMIHRACKEFLHAESSSKIMLALKRPLLPYKGTVNTGDKVYFKASTEKKWKGPAAVIGRNNCLVFLRHGGEVIRVHCSRVNPIKGTSMGDMKNDENKSIDDKIEKPEDEDMWIIPNLEYDEEAGIEDEHQEIIPIDNIETEAVPQQTTPIESQDDETESDITLKKGEYVKFENEEGESVVARVMNRAGKANRKYKNWYNFEDIKDKDAVYCEDFTTLKGFHRIEDITEYSNENEHTDNEVYFCEEELFANAKKVQLDMWESYGVYEEVPMNEVEENQKILNTTWVCSIKNNLPKARLVVRGYQEDTSQISKESPTCNKETVRILLVLSATNRWKVNSLDFKAAFLQGAEFVREVYIYPPKEAEVEQNVVWKLVRCVYGLADASLTWYTTLKAVMLNLGAKIAYDPALFYWINDNRVCGFLSMHVDDLIYAGEPTFEEKIIPKIKKSFDISLEQSDCFQFLGIKVKQNEDYSSTIDQIHFIEKLSGTNPDLKGRKTEDLLTEKEFKDYQQKIGKLLWICNQTRPDISFDTCVLGSKMPSATIGDYKKCTKVIRVLKNEPCSINFKTIGNLSSMKIVLYADASLNNLPKGGSQGGHLIFLTGDSGYLSLISWCAKRLRVCVRSTIHAETLSVSLGLENCIYLAKLLRLLLGINNIPIICKTDSKALCDHINSEKEATNKRLALEIYNIKDLISNEYVTVQWVSAKFQLADILTKTGVSRENLFKTLKGGVC